MSASYSPTPYLWLTIPSLIFYAVLGIYAWQRRRVPAALPFALFCLFAGLWTLGHSFELMATTPADWLSWRLFQAVWQLPAATVVFCFVVQYAGLGHRLTRRVMALLALPSLIVALIILTNDLHGSLWWLTSPTAGADMQPGPIGWLLNVFSLILSLLNIWILARLILRSSLDRWPAALIMANLLFMRAAQITGFLGNSPFAPLEPVVLSFIPAAAIFALALFGFRIFDPIRLARQAVLDQMADGIVVLDTGQRVADMNRPAEAMLGTSLDRARGRPVAGLLPVAIDLNCLTAARVTPAEFTVGAGDTTRHTTAQATPLYDGRGRLHGCLLLLRDVTEQRRAEAQLLAQQRALATLQERERLARELHDSAGQMLAFASLQAEVIRSSVRNGDTAAADAQLAQLAAAAQGAHVDVRESILSLKAASAEDQPFAAALARYLDTYAARYNLHIELAVADGLDDPFAPETSVQVLRVVQEALTNARKHGQAHHIGVTVGREDGSARVVVADDGQGFDPGAVGDGHYGLAIMRERMAQVGGRLAIESQPGAGTRVALDAPMIHRYNQELTGGRPQAS